DSRVRVEAASGGEGIALAAEHLPDVILLDLELPDMHGTDVARELRNAARTARLPIVALSARRDLDEGDRLAALGFDGYLEKPIDVGEFPDQVRSYCSPAWWVCQRPRIAQGARWARHRPRS